MICGFPKFPKICSKFARIPPEKLRIWTLSTQCDFYIIIWCGSIRMKILIFTIPLISTLQFMFHLTLKLKFLEKWKCKSTAFCNLYLINSGLFSSDLFSWHFSEKKPGMGRWKIFRWVRLPTPNWLSGFNSRLRLPKCSYKFYPCQLISEQTRLTISQVNDLVTANDQ